MKTNKMLLIFGLILFISGIFIMFYAVYPDVFISNNSNNEEIKQNGALLEVKEDKNKIPKQIEFYKNGTHYRAINNETGEYLYEIP